MANVFLISEQTIKQNSVINDNVESAPIYQAIVTAQDIYLQELIGTKLLNKIKDLVTTGDIETSADYKLLLDDYITPFLTFRVLSDIQFPLAFKNRNLGVVTTGDSNIYNAALKDVQVIAQHYENKASFFATRMSKYLCHNANKYPEYTHCDCEGFGAKSTVYVPTCL